MDLQKASVKLQAAMDVALKNPGVCFARPRVEVKFVC